MSVLRWLKSRYYVPSPGKSLPVRAWRFATRRHVPAFPRNVQIQTLTGCNGACVFCPYPRTVESQPKGFMSEELFRKIVDEIATHPVRRVSPYLMNEPFLDPRLLDRIEYIRKKAPKARVVVTTNGSRLSPEVCDRLLDSGGLHALCISFQGVVKEGYEATMKGSLRFEETRDNVEHLIGRWQEMDGRRKPKVVVTMVATNQVDVGKASEHWKARGVEFRWTPLENRGGNVEASGFAPSSAPMRRYGHCTRLFKQAYILFDGAMVLCCTDYTRRMVLGNVAESSIREVWNGPKAWAIRRLYAEGRIDELPLCRDCEIGSSDS